MISNFYTVPYINVTDFKTSAMVLGMFPCVRIRRRFGYFQIAKGKIGRKHIFILPLYQHNTTSTLRQISSQVF